LSSSCWTNRLGDRRDDPGVGADRCREGIETAEQLAAVRELGCDIGQGDYFARPGAAADVTPLLESPQPFAALLSSP